LSKVELTPRQQSRVERQKLKIEKQELKLKRMKFALKQLESGKVMVLADRAPAKTTTKKKVR